MIDLLINNAQIVTVNEKGEILKNSSIAIEENRIISIGDTKELSTKYSEVEKIIDAIGKVVFPGLVNNHNHLF